MFGNVSKLCTVCNQMKGKISQNSVERKQGRCLSHCAAPSPWHAGISVITLSTFVTILAYWIHAIWRSLFTHSTSDSFTHFSSESLHCGWVSGITEPARAEMKGAGRTFSFLSACASSVDWWVLWANLGPSSQRMQRRLKGEPPSAERQSWKNRHTSDYNTMQN